MRFFGEKPTQWRFTRQTKPNERPNPMKTQFTISRDRNGNRICRVKLGSAREFSIQTNGNLPATHRNGICDQTAREVVEYVRHVGTPRQRHLLEIS